METTEQGIVRKENYKRNVQSSFPFLISYIDCDKSCIPTSYCKMSLGEADRQVMLELGAIKCNFNFTETLL